MAQDSDFETVIRRSWTCLVAERLPEAAAARGWPVTTAAGFQRVLLDHVIDAPCQAATAGQSARSVPLFDLVLAIEIAERLLAGDLDIAALDRRSRAGAAPQAGAAQGRPPDGETATIDLDEAEADALAAEAGLSAADLVARIRARSRAERAARSGKPDA